jgi:formylglycine-generating enzyme
MPKNISKYKETSPKRVFQQLLPNSKVSFNMVHIKGGRFDMGGESWRDDALPIHTVELSDYWIGQFPVTQEVWEAVMGMKNKSRFRGKLRPVDIVSWEDIDTVFLPRINALTQDVRPEGTVYQLPTEAQWEFAARGGEQSMVFDYAGGNKLDDVGWYAENGFGETKPVGLKLYNELGLYDMSGNVWEWCRDWYSDDYYKECKAAGVVMNPPGPEKGDSRVLRGGSWYYDPRHCRVSYRFIARPATRVNVIGFRLVLVPNSSVKLFWFSQELKRKDDSREHYGEQAKWSGAATQGVRLECWFKKFYILKRIKRRTYNDANRIVYNSGFGRRSLA